MKCVLIKEDRGSTPQVVDIENTLKAFYETLKCELIEIPRRQINGKYFDIICDEEGLLKGRSTIAVTFDDEGHDVEGLVGSLLIVNSNDEGETVGLTDEEIALIMDKSNFKTGTIWHNEDQSYETREILCCRY